MPAKKIWKSKKLAQNTTKKIVWQEKKFNYYEMSAHCAAWIRQQFIIPSHFLNSFLNLQFHFFGAHWKIVKISTKKLYHIHECLNEELRAFVIHNCLFPLFYLLLPILQCSSSFSLENKFLHNFSIARKCHKLSLNRDLLPVV